MKADLKTEDEIQKMSPRYNKSYPQTIQKMVRRYNKWVCRQRRSLEVWRPRPWRTNLKEPFKFTNIFFSTKDTDVEDYPIIGKMDAEAEKEPEED